MEWEPHDDGSDASWESTDGRYTIRTDSVYGYHTVHLAGDESESIGEDMSLQEAKAIAQRHSDSLIAA